MPEIKLKSGKLSAYGFTCGYVEHRQVGKVRIKMWHEGCVYHVLAFDECRNVRLFWESFDSLPDARKRFEKFRVG